jgi:hypothetical protein
MFYLHLVLSSLLSGDYIEVVFSEKLIRHAACIIWCDI